MRQWKADLLQRYRLLLFLGLAFLFLTIFSLATLVHKNWRLDKFQSLESGMSRSALVEIIGEPQHKEVFAARSRLFSAIGEEGGGKYVEYSYYLKSFASLGGTRIRGIILDKNENRIEFIDLRTEIVDHFRIGEPLLLLLICSVLAFLVLLILTRGPRRFIFNKHGIPDK